MICAAQFFFVFDLGCYGHPTFWWLYNIRLWREKDDPIILDYTENIKISHFFQLVQLILDFTSSQLVHLPSFQLETSHNFVQILHVLRIQAQFFLQRTSMRAFVHVNFLSRRVYVEKLVILEIIEGTEILVC